MPFEQYGIVGAYVIDTLMGLIYVIDTLMGLVYLNMTHYNPITWVLLFDH